MAGGVYTVRLELTINVRRPKTSLAKPYRFDIHYGMCPCTIKLLTIYCDKDPLARQHLELSWFPRNYSRDNSDAH